MMDKLYVPQTRNWTRFFNKTEQRGGGKRLVPIRIEAVTPAEQTMRQAASELERENIKPETIAKLVQKPIERQRGKTTSKKGKSRAKKSRVTKKSSRRQKKKNYDDIFV